MIWLFIIMCWFAIGAVFAGMSTYNEWQKGNDQTYLEIIQWSAFFILVGPLTLVIIAYGITTEFISKLNLKTAVLKGKASVKVERTLRNTD